MNKKKFALAFRIGALIFAVCGVLAQLGVFIGEISGAAFMYYTIQSNLMAIALFAMLAARTARSLKEEGDFCGFYPRFEMVCVVNILVTFIVFWTMLSSEVEPSYLWTFENFAVHTMTPILCLIDYLLFTKGGHLKYRDIYLTAVFPLGYVAFSAIAGAMGYVYSYAGFYDNLTDAADLVPVRAPYFFLDYYTIGAWTIAYIVGILIFILLLGHGFYALDKRRAKSAASDNG